MNRYVEPTEQLVTEIVVRNISAPLNSIVSWDSRFFVMTATSWN
jgi:hypothetical protein